MARPTSNNPAFLRRPAKPKRRWGRGLLVLLLLLGLSAAGFYAYVRSSLQPVSDTPRPTEFEVLPGWGGNRVAAALHGAGLVKNARMFAYYLRYRDLDRSIGEGLYDLDPALGAAELAALLVAGGRPRTSFVVIPEGYRLQDVARSLAGAGFGDGETLLSLMQSPGDLRPAYLPEDAPLEGYLFPAGYDIPLTASPQDALDYMLRRFERELSPEVEAGLEAIGLSVHGWVTLASIVQAEAADAEEMPIIAGVFLNRLDLDMRLQSDPTVAYGLGKNLPELDAPAGDFDIDTPWNTYTRGGLPASPINSPGREALRSVLNATRHNENGQAYLYFLHGNDNGESVFRPNLNLEDHNRDVQTYLR